jgi:hypothetical protein
MGAEGVGGELGERRGEIWRFFCRGLREGRRGADRVKLMDGGEPDE